MNFVLNPNFFPTGTKLSLKVQARMEDKGRIKNLKSLLAFFEKFSRGKKERKKERKEERRGLACKPDSYGCQEIE